VNDSMCTCIHESVGFFAIGRRRKCNSIT